MKSYVLTSRAFEGEVVISNNKGKLTANFIDSTITVGQQRFVLEMMTKGIDEMLKHFNRPGGGSEMIESVVDFDMFWNRYDDKISSSKKRTEAKWDKMSDLDRSKAYRFVNRYFASIPNGTRKKYAETYLNAELWNN